MTTKATAFPPSSGTLETPNGVAKISRSPREGLVFAGESNDRVIVEYRGARVHIYRDSRATWRIRVMDIGNTFTDSAPKATKEGECVLLAIKDVDRAIRMREEARRR